MLMDEQEKGVWARKIDQLALAMEKMKLAEYMEYMNDTKRLLKINFMAGIARGFGMAVGLTVLGAVFIIMLRRLVMLNLPLIGDFIAEIVRTVNERLTSPF